MADSAKSFWNWNWNFQISKHKWLLWINANLDVKGVRTQILFETHVVSHMPKTLHGEFSPFPCFLFISLFINYISSILLHLFDTQKHTLVCKSFHQPIQGGFSIGQLVWDPKFSGFGWKYSHFSFVGQYAMIKRFCV